MPFEEDKIIKQLFKLNYDKQMTIKKLENKIKTSNYHLKYKRNDLRTLQSKYDILNKYVDKYEDCISMMIKIFKLDVELINDIKKDVGILNDDFILIIKEKPFRENISQKGDDEEMKNF